MKSTIHMKPGDFTALVSRQDGSELWVFATPTDADLSGFRNGRHREYPFMRSITIKFMDPEFIRSLILSRVIVTRAAYEFSNRDTMGRIQMQRLKEVARGQLRAPPAIWMDL